MAFFALKLPSSTSNLPQGMGLNNIIEDWTPDPNQPIHTLGFPIIGDLNTIFPNNGTFLRVEPGHDQVSKSGETIKTQGYAFSGVAVGGASGSGITDSEGHLIGILYEASTVSPEFYGLGLPSTFLEDFAKFQELAKQSMQTTP